MISLKVSSDSFPTTKKIIWRIVLIGQTLHWIPHLQIKLLSQILPVPFRRSHIPHPLIVQRHQYSCPSVWIHLSFCIFLPIRTQQQQHKQQLKNFVIKLVFLYLSCVSGKSISKIVKSSLCRRPLSRTKSTCHDKRKQLGKI